jgi:hypothetical protein
VSNEITTLRDLIFVIRAVVVALAMPVLLTGCGSTAPAAPTVVTVTATPPAAVTAPTAAAPASAAPTKVTLPEVKGRNGGIVYDELKELGLTNVEMASRDKADTVVVVPQNWTAVKIEPAAGTEVRSNQTVVVTMTKK